MWILIGICLAALGGEIYWRAVGLNQLASQFTAENNRMLAQRALIVAADKQAAQLQWDQAKAKDEALLHDPGWLSGSLTRERHEAEWTLRMAHDVRFAQTFRETNILTMQKLGRDAALSAQDALEQVARLAAPADSRVEVTPDGTGFQVRVAFMMSRLSKGEVGAVTKHQTIASMRSEVRELSSRVLRDLYEYCGSRDIQFISVTCNHTLLEAPILEGATVEENTELFRESKPVAARLYRISLDQSHAEAVTDWRQTSLSRVGALSTVEYDGFPRLKLTHRILSNQGQQDADGELQF